MTNGSAGLKGTKTLSATYEDGAKLTKRCSLLSEVKVSKLTNGKSWYPATVASTITGDYFS